MFLRLYHVCIPDHRLLFPEPGSPLSQHPRPILFPRLFPRPFSTSTPLPLLRPRFITAFPSWYQHRFCADPHLFPPCSFSSSLFTLCLHPPLPPPHSFACRHRLLHVLRSRSWRFVLLLARFGFYLFLLLFVIACLHVFFSVSFLFVLYYFDVVGLGKPHTHMKLDIYHLWL